MKKLKMMLLSLALFAVVGGALAFKAKFAETWCVTPTTGECPLSGLACPIDSFGYEDKPSGTVRYCTTTLPEGKEHCDNNVICSSQTSTFVDTDN